MAEDTLPLNFEEFERIMIYNALTDSSYLDAAIEYIVPSYFQCKDTRTVFSILAHFYGVHKKVPNLTELKAHIIEEEHKSSLKAVVKSFEGIDKHYDKDLLLINTERFLKEKAVLATSIRTHVAIQSGRYEPAKILHEFEAACGISLVNSIGMDYLESIDQHCKDLQEVFQVIPTGWKWLDERIGGGLQAKGRAVYAFYGVTNVGKSIFLGNLAANILSQDKSVLLVTLEMSEQMYAKRISAQLSKIPFDNLPQEIEALKGSLGTYKLKHRNAKLIIKEFPPKGINPLQLKAYIERMKRKGIKFDVIVLDYLNLLAPLTYGTSSYEAIKEIAEQLRALTYYFSCPLVTASQVNRCLSVDSLVNLKDKQIKIKDLKIGDLILGKSGYVKVRYKYPIEKKKVYKIKTASGKEIICSAAHMFPTITDEVKSIESNLSVGDYLISQSNSLK
ncbi:MAG: DnaB-like helicase C-terminal domain-containing protein [Actinomycetes bacterium]